MAQLQSGEHGVLSRTGSPAPVRGGITATQGRHISVNLGQENKLTQGHLSFTPCTRLSPTFASVTSHSTSGGDIIHEGESTLGIRFAAGIFVSLR